MFGQALPHLGNAFAEEGLTNFFDFEGIFHIFVWAVYEKVYLSGLSELSISM